MEKLIGTTIWFGPGAYGYIGYGIHTNDEYERRIYVHYKQLTKKGQRDTGFRELKKGDIVEFEVMKGYYVEGTQAAKVGIIKYGEG